MTRQRWVLLLAVLVVAGTTNAASETGSYEHCPVIITHVLQLADEIERKDWGYFPETPWYWQLHQTDPRPWWADFSQLPKEFSAHWPSPRPQALGVDLLPIRLTKDVLTGEVLVQSESGEELARLAPPADD